MTGFPTRTNCANGYKILRTFHLFPLNEKVATSSPSSFASVAICNISSRLHPVSAIIDSTLVNLNAVSRAWWCSSMCSTSRFIMWSRSLSLIKQTQLGGVGRLSKMYTHFYPSAGQGHVNIRLLYTLNPFSRLLIILLCSDVNSVNPSISSKLSRKSLITQPLVPFITNFQ